MKFRKKPSGIWVVDYIDETGERRRVTTGTRDRAEAHRIGPLIVAGTYVSPDTVKTQATDGRMTVDELFRHCELTIWKPGKVKAQATIKSNLKLLRERIGSEPVAEITKKRLEALAEEMEAEGYAPATIKRKLDTLSKALGVAEGLHDTRGRVVITTKPKMPSITVRNYCDRVLEPDEEAAVFAAIEKRREAEPGRDWQRFGLLIRFMLDTGCRLGEALNARVERIETFSGRTWVTFPIYTTKNDKPRQLPLTRAIEENIELLKAMAGPDGRLFPYSPANVWYKWTNMRDDLAKLGFDISDVKLHTLRHTCLTKLARTSLPIHKIMQWAGHSSIEITVKRYAHLRPEETMDALHILDGLEPPRSHPGLRLVS
ncbi:tyrosine-type recombinase/integrase [Caulobacter vibrioides]|uniref:Integrase n=1 Tax=Caulobacter phage S2B TaxID=2759120 RepID=A0AAE7MLA0_9CAUD|nr:site-specific integrase [Caulobacter vibrioides]QOC54170.1 integrase [Caulobacter phage S2B]QXZ50213.1 site-specific integrase [Caulobacter vibrioides]